MRIDNIVQNSADWLLWRKNKIGASDFAILAANAGYSKNIFKKSIVSLLKDKLKKQEQAVTNYKFKRGHELEPVIIKYLLDNNVLHDMQNNLETGIIEQYNDNPRIIASLDACTTDIVIEIKTTSMSESKFDDMVNYYKYQILHQMLCSGKESGILVIYKLDDDNDFTISDNNLSIYMFNLSDFDIDKERWITMCNNFLLNLDNVENTEMATDFNQYFTNKESIDRLIAENDTIKQNMINKLNGTGILIDKDIIYSISERKTLVYDAESWFNDYLAIRIVHICDMTPLELIYDLAKYVNYKEFAKCNQILIPEKYLIETKIAHVLSKENNK